MWFEILPSAAIITVALSVPIYAMYGLQKLVLGNAFRRNMDERFDRVMYQRDFRLTDNPYVMNGLEAVPDEEEKKKTEDVDPDQDTEMAKNSKVNKADEEKQQEVEK